MLLEDINEIKLASGENSIAAKTTIEAPKIVGKIDLPEKQYVTPHGHKVITDSEMLEELDNAEDEQAKIIL